jgi:hypothetical protein
MGCLSWYAWLVCVMAVVGLSSPGGYPRSGLEDGPAGDPPELDIALGATKIV